MKRKKCIALALSLLPAMPLLLSAEEQEVEFLQVVTIGASVLPMDDTLENPFQENGRSNSCRHVTSPVTSLLNPRAYMHK